MSNDTGVVGGDRPVRARTVGLFRRTALAVRGALGRRDGRAIFAATAFGYFVLLEVVAANLGAGDGSLGLLVVDDPLAALFEQVAPFRFEPIALVSLGPIEYLFAPITAAIAVGVAVLVGVNLAVSWVVWRGPQACRINPGVGAVAGLPGLFSGFVCCGPTILLVVGVQASAGLVAAFQWALPIAVVLLVASLLWVGRQVEL
mgnify:CR=1 FL=1